MLRCPGSIRNKIERFKRRAVILFCERQAILTKVVTLLRKQPIGDRERDWFARAAESFGFFYALCRLHAHPFKRMLKRRERGWHSTGIARKMQDARHLRPCFAVRAGKRHGQSAFDRIGSDAKVLVAGGKLPMKI